MNWVPRQESEGSLLRPADWVRFSIARTQCGYCSWFWAESGLILTGVSAIARQYYVVSLLRMGLSDIELGRRDRINTTVARLTEAGAQQEADILLRLKSESGTR